MVYLSSMASHTRAGLLYVLRPSVNSNKIPQIADTRERGECRSLAWGGLFIITRGNQIRRHFPVCTDLINHGFWVFCLNKLTF